MILLDSSRSILSICFYVFGNTNIVTHCENERNVNRIHVSGLIWPLDCLETRGGISV